MTWRDACTRAVPDVADDALRRARAGFLGRAGAGDLGTLAELTERDRSLEAHEGDFVLWFEADLYDQLQLIQILSRLAGLGVATERITLRMRRRARRHRALRRPRRARRGAAARAAGAWTDAAPR